MLNGSVAHGLKRPFRPPPRKFRQVNNLAQSCGVVGLVKKPSLPAADLVILAAFACSTALCLANNFHAILVVFYLLTI
jgi:hypothetical protein